MSNFLRKRSGIVDATNEVHEAEIVTQPGPEEVCGFQKQL